MILKLQTQNRVYRAYYGGKRLDAFYNLPQPKDDRFPEEWIASTVRAFNVGREEICEGLSRCQDGTLFKERIEADSISLLGEGEVAKHGANLSILVKLLDAAERLFIQCHPTVPFAKKYFNSPFGKTECWYILDAEADASVYLGFKPNVTREEWEDCFKREDTAGLLNMMHRISVKEGDVVFVSGGVPHAIGGGCLLCELQEPTDLMVIPERRSDSGIVLADQKMHGGLGFERMFDCFTYEGVSEEELRRRYVRHADPIQNGITTLVGADLTDRFSMQQLNVSDELNVDLLGAYAVGIVIDGSLTFIDENGDIVCGKKGDQLFLGADSKSLTVSGNGCAIICRPICID